jgi:hypothetical protein
MIEELMKTLGYSFEENPKSPTEREENKRLCRSLHQALCGLDYSDLISVKTSPYYFKIRNYYTAVDEACASVSVKPDKYQPPTIMLISDDGDGRDDNPKSGMESIAPVQIVEGAAVPARTEANARGMMQNRVTIPQMDSMEMIDDDNLKDILGYIEEIIDMILEGEELIPYPEEVVVRRMARPSQKADYVDSSCRDADAVSNPKIHQTAEVFSSDARPITAEDGPEKWEFAGYVYAMTDVFKKQKWYAFGKSPPEVAKRIATVCMARNGDMKIVLTDYSRFDGHVSAICRHAIRRLYTRAYEYNKYYLERITHHMAQRYYRAAIVDTKGKAMRFKKYFEQNSGDQNTSNLGSFINATISYSSSRRLGMMPREAFDKLGMYGGDDGVGLTSDCQVLIKTARDFGQIIEAEELGENDYVQFLARVYGPNVYIGDANSCADIGRQLQKFFITEKKGVAVGLKLWQKAFSHSLNDINTPILGPLCVSILNVAEKIGYRTSIDNIKKNMDGTPESFYTQTKDVLSHWGVIALAYDAGFPNTHDDWMEVYVRKTIPDFDFADFEVKLHAANLVAHSRLKEREYELDPKNTISKKRRYEIGDYVLAPFTALGSFANKEAKYKQGTVAVLRTTSEEIDVVTVGPNRTPSKDDSLEIPDPVPRYKVLQYEIYRKILDGTLPVPYPDLSPGARKCLFLAQDFVDRVKAAYPRGHKSCHIVYAGAYGEDVL